MFRLLIQKDPMPKFNFEKSILSMNAMYRLPIAPYCTLKYEIEWQEQKFGTIALATGRQYVIKRLLDFFGVNSILRNELDEYRDIVTVLSDPNCGPEQELDALVMLADLLADIQVYCASEMVRFGLPVQEILQIVMQSNESKLGVDGQPIYNEQGKFMKGPNYWAPEPKIRALLQELIAAKEKKDGASNLDSNQY